MATFQVSQFKSEGDRYWQVSSAQGVYPRVWYSVNLLDSGEYVIDAGVSGRTVKPDGSLGKRIIRAIEAHRSED